MMIRILFCCLFALVLPTSVAVEQQSTNDIQDITRTLGRYIEGSSYNNTTLIESAFTNNASLYLTAKNGFTLFSPKQYADLFKKREQGVFNGRNGKILAIDVYKDIATAKVEISIPKRNLVYIDLFLLKKQKAGWLIISKTATQV